MSNRIKVRNPIHPIIGLLFVIAIIIYGMIMSNSYSTLLVFAFMFLMFLCYGYFYACLLWLPFTAIFCGILGAITYGVSLNINDLISTIIRALSICIALIPGIGLSTTHLTRALETAKLPRFITLGIMITFSFIPVLMKEIKKIIEAMRIRQANNLFNPKIFYRAFLIPLIMQIINISDTLSLSIETRGFDMNTRQFIPYKTVKFDIKDLLFVVLVTTCIVLGIVYPDILTGVITW